MRRAIVSCCSRRRISGHRGGGCPTFALSCDDDLFGTAAAARHIAASVSGARLLVFPSGGHIWIGRDAELFDAVLDFLAGR